KITRIVNAQHHLHKLMIVVKVHLQKTLKQTNSTPLKDASRALDLLKRPEISYKLIEKLTQAEQDLPEDVKEQVEIQVKYEGYIKKAEDQVQRMLNMEDKKIPKNIDYDDISGLATEAQDKLKN